VRVSAKSNKRNEKKKKKLKSTVMMRLMIFLCLMQLSRPSFGLPNVNLPDEMMETNEKIVQMSFEDGSSDVSDNSMEEMTTTLAYLNELPIERETNPPPTPIYVPTKAQEIMKSALTMIINDPVENNSELETSIEAQTEAATRTVTEYSTLQDQMQDQMEVESVSRTRSSKKPTSRVLKTKLERNSEYNKNEDYLETSEHKNDDLPNNSMEDTTTAADLLEADNGTNLDSGEETTTIFPTTSKKVSKQIKTHKTIAPGALLKMYVEDSHLRSPVAALIDKKSNPLLKAKKLWKKALTPNSLLDIMVVSYDSEGKRASLSFVVEFEC